MEQDFSDKEQQKREDEEETPLPQKGMFIVRTLEPDRKGGKKPVSKEFTIYSDDIQFSNVDNNFISR